jgi:peptidoglycan/LPS O-acetylase OafA/YrhL
LAVPALVGLGEISYSIYLAHPFASQVAYVTKENAHPLLSYALAIAVVLIISDALYRRIEIPSKLFLRRLLAADDRQRTGEGELRGVTVEEALKMQKPAPDDALAIRTETEKVA